MTAPTIGDEFATPQELAKRWRTTESALTSLRHRGGGPEYTKRGRRVLYRWKSIFEFEEKNTNGAA